jgi:UDP:flavonoid glycosyltransferase YjiC (YdhE family)
MAFDQFDNASRVRLLNAGREILPRHFRVSRVAELLQMMQGNATIAAACRRVSGALAKEDGVSRACDILMEQFAPVDQHLPGKAALALP